MDAHALVHERAAETGLARVGPLAAGVLVLPRESSRPGRLSRSSHPPLAVGDLAFDARLLADYGERARALAARAVLRVARAPPPARAEGSARRAARGGRARRERGARTPSSAFAERARPVAEKQAAYAAAIDELRRAEDLLRSRDRVLAAEQDAQNARIAQVDARLSQLEEELAQAQADERAAAGELAATQAALAREEAKWKRAELELRAAQQRESSGEAGG